MIKQVIVMRKDLKMRKGKMCAQAAHASMKVFFDLNESKDESYLKVKLNSDMKKWVHGSFAKICVGVNSLAELYEIYNKAKDMQLPCALIVDAGRTEFHGEPTETCIAIGPANSSLIDIITGDLKLL